MTGIPPSCQKEPEFKQLGEYVFLYTGKNRRERGLWVKKDFDEEMQKCSNKNCEWTHYQLGESADLKINEKLSRKGMYK